MFSGAAETSAASKINGLIVACEQTNAQLLHWTHDAGSHSGTITAVPLFSYWEAPVSNWPSAQSLNADTGSE